MGHWVKNKAGLFVSKFYGFGLMDAGMMVYLAEHWNTVPEQRRCEIKSHDENRFAFFGLLFELVEGYDHYINPDARMFLNWLRRGRKVYCAR